MLAVFWLIALLVPLVGNVMNGMSVGFDRWHYIVAFGRRLCRTRVGGEPEGAGRVGIRQGVVALAVLLLCYGLGTQSGLVSSSFGTSVVDDGRFLLVLQALGVLLVVMWCMVPRMPVGTGIWRKATEPVLAAALSASLRRCAQVRPSCFPLRRCLRRAPPIFPAGCSMWMIPSMPVWRGATGTTGSTASTTC